MALKCRCWKAPTNGRSTAAPATSRIRRSLEPIGNIGIAAHRDGFFRVLKDVVTGDTLEIETPQRTMSYRVERQWIVAPEDASVLDPTASPAVTLVTCYPFYFIGAAPQRFIVRAVRTAPETRP